MEGIGMEDQTINIRLTAIEARLAAIEGRLAEQGTVTPMKRRKKELTLEQKHAIRDRLLAGQKAKKERELAEAIAKSKEESKPIEGSKRTKVQIS
jgi:hypothetical protein